MSFNIKDIELKGETLASEINKEASGMSGAEGRLQIMDPQKTLVGMEKESREAEAELERQIDERALLMQEQENNPEDLSPDALAEKKEKKLHELEQRQAEELQKNNSIDDLTPEL
jgi:hypothetical protein